MSRLAGPAGRRGSFIVASPCWISVGLVGGLEALGQEHGDCRSERVHVLYVTTPIGGLTADSVRAGMARLVAFAEVAGWELDYFRIRFATGHDVCFWDATARRGLCLLDDKVTEFEDLEPAWPSWYQRLEAIQHRPRAARAA